MDFLFKLLVAVLMALAGGVERARADAMVTGSVFCDQCKDGQMTLFDYPLSGARIAVACPGSDGEMSVVKEETTNWFGNYAVSFPGSPDLRRCMAQVVADSSSRCGAAAGPARELNLFFSMFDMEMYNVGSLLSQPAQPMDFCQNSNNPRPLPPAVQLPPPTTPAVKVPPPAAPGLKLPPVAPIMEASACPYQNWMMPEYKCYWKVVGPETKVGIAFGLAAAGRYGTEMSLWEGLKGRGDLYRTLLREATTSLLNSYNSIQFSYPTLSVVYHMNLALMGSPQNALSTALRFKRANSALHCNFTPCNNNS